jgi:DNA-binding GntR family transcriptional regulator
MTLAAFVREDLRGRLASGERSARITLRELAERYRVSLTPVREAVEDLVREGFLVKEGNGRLRVPERLPRTPASAAAGPTRPRDWHQVIARDVLRRSLRGEEGFLREESLAAEHGVGRTVLRHVFSRLAGAGMLEHVPRRGWRIRPFREADMLAYLEVRVLLELKALELARPRLVPAELLRIRSLNRVRGAACVDAELHPYLIEKSGNRFIADFFRRHGAYYTTLFYTAAAGPAAAAMARQHLRIVDALRAGRWERARLALAAHIRAQAPLVRTLMRRLASLPPERWPDLDPGGAVP